MTDILAASLYQDQVFRLFTREEVSRTAYGRTIGKRLGSAIWTIEYTTHPMPNDDAVAFEALLNSFDGVVTPFEAADLRRRRPRAHPTGGSNGTLLSVNANNKALALAGLSAGQIVSPGDYLAFDYVDQRALHQVVAGATANGGGITSQVEVRPHLRPGWTLNAAVTLIEPRGKFTLLPDTVQPRAQGGLHTVISFKAAQAL